jgi:transcriptional regulator with XRE-family HTH domain
LNKETQLSTNLNSKHTVLQRLRRGKDVRSKFVESHVSKTLAFQTRALREKEGWSQQALADRIGSNQNAIYRAENPSYGKQTITTLKKIAAAFDVALIVRFVPFSELVDWVSGTRRTIDGLNSAALMVPDFESEEREGSFAEPVLAPAAAVDSGAVLNAPWLGLGGDQGDQEELERVRAVAAAVAAKAVQSVFRHLAGGQAGDDLSWVGNSQDVANQIAARGRAVNQAIVTESRTGTLKKLMGAGPPSQISEQPLGESMGIHLVIDNTAKQGGTALNPQVDMPTTRPA